MNRFFNPLAQAFVVYSLGAASFTMPGHQSEPGLNLVGGKLYMDDRVVITDFSVVRTSPGFLFFYVPDVGLITIADREFQDAKPDGNFNGSSVEFDAGSRRFSLTSRENILRNGENTAWVRVDGHYALQNGAPAFGYGDSLSVPYAWPGQVRHAE